MAYYIQKKTPALRWHTIHRNLDLEIAKEWLLEISKNYDADQGRIICPARTQFA